MPDHTREVLNEMSVESLYQRLKKSNMIQSETFRDKPRRVREKAMGYMWEAEMEVKLIDGLKIIFYFWHNFYEDDGKDWFPSEEEFDRVWREKYVPIERSSTAKLRDATWHRIYEGEHIYISKEGTFSGKRNIEDIKKKIRNGSWEQDSDLWMLI